MGKNVNWELKSSTACIAKCFQREPNVWWEKKTWSMMSLGLSLREDPSASQPWEVSALFSFIPLGVCRVLWESVPKLYVRPEDRLHFEDRALGILAHGASIPALLAFLQLWGSGPAPGAGEDTILQGLGNPNSRTNWPNMLFSSRDQTKPPH